MDISISNSNLFPLILDNLGFAVVAVDKDGIIFYANTYYAKQINQNPRNILNRKMTDIYVGSSTITALKTGEEIIMEEKICPTDPSQVCTGIATPLFEGEKIIGAFSLYIDPINTEYSKIDIEKQALLLQQIKIELQGMAKSSEKHTGLGQSAAFLKVNEKAIILAATNVPILIRGEHGVGKEVIARFIHRNSQRKKKSFVTVNCAAIPENLIESELFGHEKGAFTGASMDKLGKFQLADGGTLFLDEIGDMSLNMQTKLLRAVQEGEIETVGSSKSTTVDLRIISATNQPLEQLIEQKKFRADLFYRINAFSLYLPPLRERRDDINLLIDFYLEQFNHQYNKNIKLSSKAYLYLKNYEWPGNIRELRNCIEFTVVMCTNHICSESIILDYFNQEESDNKKNIEEIPPTNHLNYLLSKEEKRIYLDVLEQCKNNRTEAMEVLGVSRRTFYRKLTEFNLL